MSFNSNYSTCPAGLATVIAETHAYVCDRTYHLYPKTTPILLDLVIYTFTFAPMLVGAIPELPLLTEELYLVVRTVLRRDLLFFLRTGDLGLTSSAGLTVSVGSAGLSASVDLVGLKILVT